MSGVEQYYNDILMGKNGSRQVLVNSRGKEVGTLSDVPAVPGKQLKLTIDLDLQIAAEEALEGKPGAIVAMDPRTGEILAMVSRPAFDPNAFAVRISRDEWNQLMTDPGKPLLNKAIQAQLAPGSVFKIIMATAGMQEGIAQDLVVNCGGGKTFYGRFFKCWIAAKTWHARQREHQQGDLPVLRFVLLHAGGEAGHQPHRQVRDHAGTGTEDRRRSAAGSLRRDAVGRVEDQELQAEVVCRRDDFRRHRAGSGGDDADSVGARDWRDYHRRIACDGRMSRFPSSFRRSSSRSPSTTTKPQIPIDEKNWMIITDAMAQVVSPMGTAGSAAVPGIDIAGKTGSAQTVSNDLKKKMGASREEHVQGQWLVRRRHAATQSGDCGCVLLRRRRARSLGCARGDEGDQGLRREAAQSPDAGSEGDGCSSEPGRGCGGLA